jgi:hypothetical protein
MNDSTLSASYDQWLSNAEKGAEEFRLKGRDVRKIDLDVDAFLIWCKRRALDINSNACIEFVSEIAAKTSTEIKG